MPSGWVLIWGRRFIQGNKVLLELVGKGTLLIPKGSSPFPLKIICQCIIIYYPATFGFAEGFQITKTRHKRLNR